ncbi:hypothetical protein Tco_0707956, partial [Tanacetum coccineum]
ARKMKYIQSKSVPHANLRVLDKLIVARHEIFQWTIETLKQREKKVKEHRRKSSLTPIRAQTATVSQAYTLIFDMGIWVETGMVIALDFIKVMVNGHSPRTRSCYCRFTGELTKSRDSLIND